MSSAELFTLIKGTESASGRVLFENYYGRFASVASRYAKNQTQAEDLFNYSFHICLGKLKQQRNAPINTDDFLEREFILAGIAFVKSIRSEYYVASTVYASAENATKNYNLFENNDIIDFGEIENEVLVKCLQQLVPSQRLVFNLHVVDGFSLAETAAVLESSEGTVKSNLEKARYNLQNNIEKTFKSLKT